MAGKEVIRAVQWFTKDGASKKVSAAKEITIGATLGMVTGLIWQVSRVEARALGRGCHVWWRSEAWLGLGRKRKGFAFQVMHTMFNRLYVHGYINGALAVDGLFVLLVRKKKHFPFVCMQTYHWNENAKWEAFYKEQEGKQ